MTHRINVKPSEIDISNELIGSALNKTEREVVARNIIIICLNSDDTWIPFSWKDYRNLCSHEIAEESMEKNYLDLFVEMKLLSFADEKYQVTDAFIAKLWEFVK